MSYTYVHRREPDYSAEFQLYVFIKTNNHRNRLQNAAGLPEPREYRFVSYSTKQQHPPFMFHDLEPRICPTHESQADVSVGLKVQDPNAQLAPGVLRDCLPVVELHIVVGGGHHIHHIQHKEWLHADTDQIDQAGQGND